jgi:acyl-CoA thioester hydrolase
MDANGHVNNAVYVRWFESARISYFERCPALMAALHAGTVGVILRRQEFEYLAPVIYPDTVAVTVSITDVGSSSFTMECEIESLASASRVATATGSLVMLDGASGSSTSVPSDIRADFDALEQTQPG